MPLLVLFLLLGLFVFFAAIYFVVKTAINNSELLNEIKIMLIKAENEKYGGR